MTPQERFTLITHYIDEINKKMLETDFQRNFFQSLEEQFLTRKRLSDKQFACLEQIYERVTR